MLDLKALKVFLTVADVASMTAAAKRLQLSQSAVSQAIRQLEDDLGTVLVDRARRPLALTAAGVALRRRGAAVVAEAESLYKAVREGAGTQAQVLRLGMVDSFAATIGPPLVKSLLGSAVHIHVASGLAPDLGAALSERRLDMIVTTDPPTALPALERHRLLAERYILLLPPALAQALPAPGLAAVSAHAAMVRFNADSHIGRQIEQYLRDQGVVPPHRLEIDTADSLVAMVAAGIGWALITPLCLLQARADPGTVVPVRLPGDFGRELTLVSRGGEYGDLPIGIAERATAIYRDEWQPRLVQIAPWLAELVSVD